MEIREAKVFSKNLGEERTENAKKTQCSKMISFQYFENQEKENKYSEKKVLKGLPF